MGYLKSDHILLYSIVINKHAVIGSIAFKRHSWKLKQLNWKIYRDNMHKFSFKCLFLRACSYPRKLLLPKGTNTPVLKNFIVVICSSFNKTSFTVQLVIFFYFFWQVYLAILRNKMNIILLRYKILKEDIAEHIMNDKNRL